MIALLLLSGCGNSADEQPRTDERPGIASNGEKTPITFDGLDQFLADMAVAKFYETDTFKGGAAARTLVEIRELYIPLNATPNFQLRSIWMLPGRAGWLAPIDISYNHASYAGQQLGFRWYSQPGSARFLSDTSQTSEGIRTSRWTQHGYMFEASVPARLNMADVVSFEDAQPVDAWELRGDAVSVSIQGMADVTILGEGGGEIAGIATQRGRRWLWMVGEHFLYSDDNERIGYQWPIDADASRYQSVLEPGAYTFRASGATGEPGLVVRHFINGIEVSTVDFAPELSRQDFSGFTVTVTAEPERGSLELDKN